LTGRLPRRSDLFALGAAVAAALSLAAVLHARAERRARSAEVEAMAGLARRLGLTDLALFNEARYTRHLSQADRFAPFQDHPVALEHFPSGSVVAPER